jgi:hypothetical protein
VSLTAAIVARFDDDADEPIVALRSGLGTNQFWVDRAPENKAVPYATVKHVATSVVSERKSLTARVEDCTVQIDVWASGKTTVETTLDLFEAAYIGKPLAISNRTWYCTYFNNRMVEEDHLNLWRGMLELSVIVST